MVTPPYNILFDVNEAPDKSITAKVKNEFLYKDELGPVGCTEAGRHLAILGSMALANENPSTAKHYYLAIGAKFKHENFDNDNKNENDECFYLSVKVNHYNAKEGEVEGIIANSNNTVLYSAIISYNPLSEALFSRLFKAHRYTLPIINEISPYKNRRSFINKTITGDTITGDYGVISPNDCEGHFHEYPAFPIAIIANLFGELGITLFLDKFPVYNKAFYSNATLSAKRLAFHGEHIIFKGTINNRTEDTLTVQVEALINNKVVARGVGELKGVKKTHDTALHESQTLYSLDA